MKLRSLLLLLVLTAITLNPCAVFAGEEIKLATFQAFCKAAGFENQYNQMMNILVEGFQQGMVSGFQEEMKDKDVPADKREKLTQLVTATSLKLKVDLDILLKKELKFEDLVTNVYLPIYRKHFSEQEIKELTSFYSSPLGKKTATLTPSMMQESSEAYNRIYAQRVNLLGAQLINNETLKLISAIKEL